MAELRELIRDIPDFPQAGIVFKDATPLFGDAVALEQAVDALAEHARPLEVDYVVAPEARGFILGAAVAARCGAGFIPVRKPGKLPYETTSVSYELEYGIEKLVEREGAEVAGVSFLMELAFLDGRSRLRNRDVFSLIRFD
jgi:adenine phosphoribosyltransferase